MIILYDLSAAFDTVSHDILLEKLKAYGFDDSSLRWSVWRNIQGGV